MTFFLKREDRFFYLAAMQSQAHHFAQVGQMKDRKCGSFKSDTKRKYTGSLMEKQTRRTLRFKIPFNHLANMGHDLHQVKLG